MTDETTYTVREVAAMAGTTEAAIRRLNQRGGRMPVGTRVEGGPGGGHLEFDRAAIDAWLPTRAGRGRPRKWKRVPA